MREGLKSEPSRSTNAFCDEVSAVFLYHNNKVLANVGTPEKLLSKSSTAVL